MPDNRSSAVQVGAGSADELVQAMDAASVSDAGAAVGSKPSCARRAVKPFAYLSAVVAILMAPTLGEELFGDNDAADAGKNLSLELAGFGGAVLGAAAFILINLSLRKAGKAYLGGDDKVLAGRVGTLSAATGMLLVQLASYGSLNGQWDQAGDFFVAELAVMAIVAATVFCVKKRALISARLEEFNHSEHGSEDGAGSFVKLEDGAGADDGDVEFGTAGAGTGGMLGATDWAVVGAEADSATGTDAGASSGQSVPATSGHIDPKKMAEDSRGAYERRVEAESGGHAAAAAAAASRSNSVHVDGGMFGLSKARTAPTDAAAVVPTEGDDPDLLGVGASGAPDASDTTQDLEDVFGKGKGLSPTNV